MKLAGWTRRTIVAVGVGATLAIVTGTASLTACGDSGQCTKVRNDTFARKKVWAACDPTAAAPCIKTFGNVRDCSGVLSCDFAVNRAYREEADQAVLTIANETQGCYLCAQPNCASGDFAICEPQSRECIIVSQLLDASTSGSATIDVAIPPGFFPDGGSD